MKGDSLKLFVAVLSFIAFSSFAGAEVDSSAVLIIDKEQIAEVSPSENSFEGGFQLHSINNGSRFLTVAFMRNLASWFSIGGRGLMPFEYSDEDQVYMGQLVSRFHIHTCGN